MLIEQTQLERAHAHAAAGSALRRAGRTAEARDALRLALDLAHRCGATALEQEAPAELGEALAVPGDLQLRLVQPTLTTESVTCTRLISAPIRFAESGGSVQPTRLPTSRKFAAWYSERSAWRRSSPPGISRSTYSRSCHRRRRLRPVGVREEDGWIVI